MKSYVGPIQEAVSQVSSVCRVRIGESDERLCMARFDGIRHGKFNVDGKSMES